MKKIVRSEHNFGSGEQHTYADRDSINVHTHFAHIERNLIGWKIQRARRKDLLEKRKKNRAAAKKLISERKV